MESRGRIACPVAARLVRQNKPQALAWNEGLNVYFACQDARHYARMDRNMCQHNAAMAEINRAMRQALAK